MSLPDGKLRSRGGPTDLEVSCLDYHKQGREASSQRIGLKVSVGSGETVRGIRLIRHRPRFTPRQTYSQSSDTLLSTELRVWAESDMMPTP